MAREFWEVFLPEGISVHSAVWNGNRGTAAVIFSYPGSTRPFKAVFVRMAGLTQAHEWSWHLDEIVEVQ